MRRADMRGSECGVREYPIEVRVHAGVDPRISRLAAANSPGYYPDVDPPSVTELMQQRSARVSLRKTGKTAQ